MELVEVASASDVCAAVVATALEVTAIFVEILVLVDNTVEAVVVAVGAGG